jgi:hypothetical protein
MPLTDLNSIWISKTQNQDSKCIPASKLNSYSYSKYNSFATGSLFAFYVAKEFY